MAPPTTSRSSAPIKCLYPRRKANREPMPIWTRMRTASQMRAHRAITRQEAHYTRHSRSSAYVDYAPTRLARASVSSSQDEVVVLASKRILRLLPRIHMVQFGPKRGLASAKNLPDKETVSLSAADNNPRRAVVESSCCAVVAKVPWVSPSEELRTRLRHLGPTIIPAQGFAASENDSSGERLALLSSIRPAEGTFYRGRVWDEM
jgi:hypothetical protein